MYTLFISLIMVIKRTGLFFYLIIPGNGDIHNFIYSAVRTDQKPRIRAVPTPKTTVISSATMQKVIPSCIVIYIVERSFFSRKIAVIHDVESGFFVSVIRIKHTIVVRNTQVTLLSSYFANSEVIASGLKRYL